MTAECVMCLAENDQQDRVWYAYAQRHRYRDALRTAQKLWPDVPLTSDIIKEHLVEHRIVQPPPMGKIVRSHALQEAFSTFPQHFFLIMRALYRAGSMDRQQILRMLYLEHAGADQQRLVDQVDRDLHRLVFGSYLYKLWPEKASRLRFERDEPIYLLGARACAIVEHLERLEPRSTPTNRYATSLPQVSQREFEIERDLRQANIFVRMRSSLYDRTFLVDDDELTLHLAIEHWHSASQMSTTVTENNNEIAFDPSALIGVRVDAPLKNMSSLLPLWLHYDRGTTDLNDEVSTILRYPAYYASDAFSERYPRLAENGVTGPLVVICEDAERRSRVQGLLVRTLEGRTPPIYLTERPTLSADPWAEEILLTVDGSTSRFDMLERTLSHGQALIERMVFDGTDALTDPVVGGSKPDPEPHERERPRVSDAPARTTPTTSTKRSGVSVSDSHDRIKQLLAERERTVGTSSKAPTSTDSGAVHVDQDAPAPKPVAHFDTWSGR